MGRILKPLSGRLIVSAIYSSLANMIDAVKEMEKKYDQIELETDEIEFLHTKYYREEMGGNLKRKFFAFEKPIDRGKMAEIKIFTNKLEAKYGEKVDDFVFRKVNLDPGILTLANLVLASTKDFSHRVYLGEGIYGEVTLIYERKKFRSLPWTYPDYTEPEVINLLTAVRSRMQGMEYE
jgi:hypothetical protein